MTALSRLDRTRAGESQNVPRPTRAADIVTVETTWGALQPLQPLGNIRTVGELEVADLVQSGAQLIDTRVPDPRSGSSLPGAVNIPHDQVVDRREELDLDRVHILFCNGPQCPQTPDALRLLSDAGHPWTAWPTTAAPCTTGSLSACPPRRSEQTAAAGAVRERETTARQGRTAARTRQRASKTCLRGIEPEEHPLMPRSVRVRPSCTPTGIRPCAVVHGRRSLARADEQSPGCNCSLSVESTHGESLVPVRCRRPWGTCRD